MAAWPHYLTPQLMAQLAFAAVSPGNYEKIKVAILIRYGINEEEYRRRFRSAKRKDGEMNRVLPVRLIECMASQLAGGMSHCRGYHERCG